MSRRTVYFPSLAHTACLAAALTLSACATLHEPPTPAVEIPSAWAEQASSDAALAAADWWSSFGSVELAQLVASALSANPDLAVALERVRQAEAQVRIVGASLFPVLTLGAATSRRETHGGGNASGASEATSATFNASYEFDLWGRNAFDTRAAEYSLRASSFDLETVRLTLIAGVANAYFQVLSLRSRLAIARENLAIAERVLGVVDIRVRNGVASGLDVARQQTAVLSQRAVIPALELQERQTLFSLALLLGRPPENFNTAATSLAELAVPRIAAGLPTNLLTRRPDLASAEAQLAAANANVAAARAALLPSIQLTGSAGVATDALLSIANSPVSALALGASLLQPIFEGGRLRAQVDLAASRERELVENYRGFILSALGDVESALAAASRSADQESLQEQVGEQARRTLRLAEIRYREGVDDLLSVLDAQRTLFQVEDQLAQIRLSRLQASIDLFKALGGGWRMAEPLERLTTR